MTKINIRILQLFKTLNIKQTEFANQIGVSQAYISKLLKTNSDKTPSERIIKIICTEFDVNEEWLRNGTGDMFMKTETAVISELSAKYNLDDLDRSIIETYLRLDRQDRKIIKAYIASVVENLDKKDSCSYNQEENDDKNSRLSLVAEDGAEYKVDDRNDSIANEVENYRLELEAEAKGKTSSALDDSKGNSKDTKTNKIS